MAQVKTMKARCSGVERTGALCRNEATQVSRGGLLCGRHYEIEIDAVRAKIIAARKRRENGERAVAQIMRGVR